MTACTGDQPNADEIEAAVGAPNDHTVLILAPSVTSGLSSREAQAAIAAGYTVEVVSSAGWTAKSQADFATYRALILGDPTCGVLSSVSSAIANRSVWGPIVKGNVILIGTDPVFHHGQGGASVTTGAVKFAAAEPGLTGAYICLSCYYHGVAVNTPVPLLEPFQSAGTGSFTVRGVGCFDNAHKVANHVSLTGITDTTLSNWGCSVHEAFDHFPTDFVPLAIAQGSLGPGTIPFADGSVGVPYIMARGKTLVPANCGNGVVEMPEQCDDGNTNNCDGCSAQCKLESSVCGNGTVDCGEQCDDGNTNSGDGCSNTCTTEICGNGTLDPGEQCDDGNTTSGDGCSSTCQNENAPPVAVCTNRTVISDGTCSGDASVDGGSFDPDGNLAGCVQSPAGPYSGVGTNAVTLTCTDTAGLSSSCTATVTLVDLSPPSLTCPADITLECVGGSATATYTSTAADNCSLTSHACAPPSGSTFPVGTTPGVCTAEDASGNSSSCGFSVTVADTQAPVVTTQDVEYWPPNHKYRQFDLNDCVTSVSDACNGSIAVTAANAQITRITSDEKEDANGNGDGHTCNDMVLTGAITADLRAERQGNGNGRVYTVFFEVSDGNGNTTASSCQVRVPHDQSCSAPAPDDGCAFCVGSGCGSCPGHNAACTY